MIYIDLSDFSRVIMNSIDSKTYLLGVDIYNETHNITSQSFASKCTDCILVQKISSVFNKWWKTFYIRLQLINQQIKKPIFETIVWYGGSILQLCFLEDHTTLVSLSDCLSRNLIPSRLSIYFWQLYSLMHQVLIYNLMLDWTLI